MKTHKTIQKDLDIVSQAAYNSIQALFVKYGIEDDDKNTRSLVANLCLAAQGLYLLSKYQKECDGLESNIFLKFTHRLYKLAESECAKAEVLSDG